MIPVRPKEPPSHLSDFATVPKKSMVDEAVRMATEQALKAIPRTDSICLKKEVDAVKQGAKSPESIIHPTPDPALPTPYGSFEDYLAFD